MRTRDKTSMVVLAGVASLACAIGAVAAAASSRSDGGSATRATVAPTSVTTIAAAGAVTPAAAAVRIVDFAFAPQTSTVHAGAVVTWTNADSFAHSIRSNDGTFDEQRMDKGASATVTFAKPWSYAYICGIHNSMTGTVVVEP